MIPTSLLNAIPSKSHQEKIKYLHSKSAEAASFNSAFVSLTERLTDQLLPSDQVMACTPPTKQSSANDERNPRDDSWVEVSYKRKKNSQR